MVKIEKSFFGVEKKSLDEPLFLCYNKNRWGISLP